MYDTAIIGGGLAGLTTGILLSRKGMNVAIFEKKEYPFHKVCGEYISNEIRPFLEDLCPEINAYDSPDINTLHISSLYGKQLQLPLDTGGFGLSRYTLDYLLYQAALRAGATIFTNTEIRRIESRGNQAWTLHTTQGKAFDTSLVTGSYGKRSTLDKKLGRPFIFNRSPYIGVKYHIKGDYPSEQIALHNFPGGYAGLSKVEDDTYCLCYLARREHLRQQGNIPALEQNILARNTHLKQIFNESYFLWNKPLTINEISFEAKSAVENHILMAGDAAGMIAPLCGNGMSMAIHGGKLLAETVLEHSPDIEKNRHLIEQAYAGRWKKYFGNRLFAGRQIQRFFGRGRINELFIWFFKKNKNLGRKLVKATHGPEIPPIK